jgi:hypothetical protein
MFERRPSTASGGIVNSDERAGVKLSSGIAGCDPAHAFMLTRLQRTAQERREVGINQQPIPCPT